MACEPDQEPLDEGVERFVRQNPYILFEDPRGEATTAVVVAPRRGLDRLRLPDNVEGVCSSCGAAIEMRPETARLPVERVCVECALAERFPDSAPGAF